MKQKPRVLIGKVGLDGHDVGARVIARALADAGIEVIYTGLRQTPAQIVKPAIEEGVDMIGISILSGSHMTLLVLKQMGVNEIFPPETPTSEIIDFVRNLIEGP